MKINDEKWYRFSPEDSWFKSKESQDDKPLKYNVVKNYGESYFEVDENEVPMLARKIAEYKEKLVHATGIEVEIYSSVIENYESRLKCL